MSERERDLPDVRFALALSLTVYLPHNSLILSVPDRRWDITGESRKKAPIVLAFYLSNLSDYVRMLIIFGEKIGC